MRAVEPSIAEAPTRSSDISKLAEVNHMREIIAARVEDLSPAEKRCAHVLLADYPGAGLASAASLANAAGTSIPTVLRFLGRLGFGTYRDFQRLLRDEITREATSPVQRAARSRAERKAVTDFTAAVAQRLAIAEQLVRTVPQGEFDATVRLLAGRPKRTLIAGGYFTRHLAFLLASQLDQIVPEVDYTPDPLTRDVTKYLGLRKDGVVILFDFRRYEESAITLASLVKSRGASLVIITDHELSPCAQLADVVLPVYVDGIPFDSDAGVLILVESLVECVFNAVGDAGIRRMAKWEKVVQVPRTFGTGSGPSGRAAGMGTTRRS